MMHTEFTTITGIEVSHRYYTERIEPKYSEQNIDKQDFCTAWVKEHKSDICKAFGSDFDGLVRDAALTDALRNESAERKLRADKAEQEAKRLEAENENLRWENDRIKDSEKRDKEMIESMSSDLRDSLDENTEHIKAIAEKDTEIMRLKAMLFDMMYKTA